MPPQNPPAGANTLTMATKKVYKITIAAPPAAHPASPVVAKPITVAPVVNAPLPETGKTYHYYYNPKAPPSSSLANCNHWVYYYPATETEPERWVFFPIGSRDCPPPEAKLPAFVWEAAKKGYVKFSANYRLL
ncbi:hypothetical protein RUND412_008726 [Rhizina undulata]